MELQSNLQNDEARISVYSTIFDLHDLTTTKSEVSKLRVSVDALENLVEKLESCKSRNDIHSILEACLNNRILNKMLYLHVIALIRSSSSENVLEPKPKRRFVAKKETTVKENQVRVIGTRRRSKEAGVRVVQQKFWYKCVFRNCKFSDYTEKKLMTHYKLKHNLSYNSSKLPYDELQVTQTIVSRDSNNTKCYRCSKTFSNSTSLSSHIRHVHVPDQYKSYSCPDCFGRFLLDDDLKYHMVECKPVIMASKESFQTIGKGMTSFPSANEAKVKTPDQAPSQLSPAKSVQTLAPIEPGKVKASAKKVSKRRTKMEKCQGLEVPNETTTSQTATESKRKPKPKQFLLFSPQNDLHQKQV